MLKLISTISISRRLLIAFMLAAVIPGIVISILGFAFTTEQKNRSRAIQTDIGALQTATTASSYLPRLRDLLKTLYQDHDEDASAALKRQIPDVIAQLNTFSMLFDDKIRTYQQKYEVNTSAQMSKTRSILLNKDTSTDLPAQQQTVLGHVQNTSWPEYYVAQERVIGAITTDDNSSELATFVQYAQDKYSTLTTDWDRLVHITENMNYTVAQIGPAETNPIILSTLVAFLSTIFVVTAIGYIVYLTITRPLHQLALLTRRIAQGETSARAVINGHDEIGLVAQSMNTMLDHIVHLIHDMQLQRDSLLARVEKLISEVSGIGEGDLRVQAEVTNDTLGILADSFNYMIEELSSLVVRVQKVSHEVSRSTMAALERMKQLVDTGQKQFQQITEAETQINHMAIANRQIAERAQLFAGVARAARQDAQFGRESVIQAIEGMGRINNNVQRTASQVHTLGERSREINEIVEVISNIAHQTNRLALDAAIQAAMAGDHGQGFGAVAADIRRLAERCKNQANLITRIVRSVREEISAVAVSMLDTEKETAAGTKVTQEAGVALEAIFAAVEQQAHEIENINQMVTQQAQSSHTVVQIMENVSELTRVGDRHTQDASRHMERLARLVEQLRASVAAFRLRSNQSYAVPTTGTTISLEEELESPLTVSGVFRKVSATAQMAQVTKQISQQDITSTTPPSSSTNSFVRYTPDAGESQPGLNGSGTADQAPA